MPFSYLISIGFIGLMKNIAFNMLFTLVLSKVSILKMALSYISLMMLKKVMKKI